MNDFSVMHNSTNYFKYFGKIADKYDDYELTFYCNLTESCDFRYIILPGEYNSLWGPEE